MMTKDPKERDLAEDVQEQEENSEEETVSEETQESGEETVDTEESENEAKEQEDENTKYMRLMADFQNYKRRVEKEKSDIYAYANEKLVVELLEVIDNFERALEVETEDTGFKEGMTMIFKQTGVVLEKAGLAEIPALGEVFDPNVHNAVMSEDTEEYESGKVSGVMQKGYTLNGKVIRPSMVRVAN